MKPIDEAFARDEICRVGRSLFDRGYVHATAGNISVHLGDGFLITPTDACLGTLDPSRLARLDAKGEQISGDRASKTIVLHRRIYEATATTGAPAGCIIHTHSTHLVACSLAADSATQPQSGNHKDEDAADQPASGRPVSNSPHEALSSLLPPITPYFVMKVGPVPHIPYFRPGAAEAADATARAIAGFHRKGISLRAIMLERLGPNVWHETPAAAMAVLEELEETARLWLMVRPAPLDESRIDELRRAFGAQWPTPH